ncbi:MAG: AEC family transporter [Jaaginema sp. PMC 1079.18]|nr:AEC family transporter [Jaaginema sp. PMC 1080.18]MEC4853158.1 AEC family transporter [Jaaginema sp. PMC 1079.18]MEC4866819.1 AEC family transporter [Jaaginema sp. PMC 1078.18]
MSVFTLQLLELYLRLVSGIAGGWILGRCLPERFPSQLGQFLFWFGVPASIVAFLRQADLAGALWLAPVSAWVAIGLGGLLAGFWLYLHRTPGFSQPFRGNFFLAAMFGNTGYFGFPIVLSLVGEKYLGWAIFYDLLGTVPGAYGLGVAIAAFFGERTAVTSSLSLGLTLIKNPTLWALGFGLWFRTVSLPHLVERGLDGFAWGIISLSLVLIGMRLSRLQSWSNWQSAAIALGIKMFLVPLILGLLLSLVGIQGSSRLAIVLQMAMPPAFATLVLAETYGGDRELAVTALALGASILLLLLPLWLLLFPAS